MIASECLSTFCFFTALEGLLTRISSHGRLITLFSALRRLEHVMRDSISDSVNALAPPTRTLTLQVSPHQWASGYANAPPTQGFGHTQACARLALADAVTYGIAVSQQIDGTPTVYNNPS